MTTSAARRSEKKALHRYLHTAHPSLELYAATVKRERGAEALITAMRRHGYELAAMNSRTQSPSLLNGFFFGRQLHTLLFRKNQA